MNVFYNRLDSVFCVCIRNTFFLVYIRNLRKAQSIDNQSYRATATTAMATVTCNRQNPQTNIFIKRWSNKYALILTLYRQTQVSNKTDFRSISFEMELKLFIGPHIILYYYHWMIKVVLTSNFQMMIIKCTYWVLCKQNKNVSSIFKHFNCCWCHLMSSRNRWVYNCIIFTIILYHKSITVRLSIIDTT